MIFIHTKHDEHTQTFPGTIQVERHAGETRTVLEGECWPNKSNDDGRISLQWSRLCGYVEFSIKNGAPRGVGAANVPYRLTQESLNALREFLGWRPATVKAWPKVPQWGRGERTLSSDEKVDPRQLDLLK